MDGTASCAPTNHTNCHGALNRTNNNDNEQDDNNNNNEEVDDDENDSDNVSHYDHDDANTPYLLSHLEVYELLQPRVQLVRRHRKGRHETTHHGRHETTSSAAVTTLPTTTTTTTTLERTSTSDQTRKPKRPRHLHWIEDQVVQYIQEQTGALEFHSTQHSLPLQSILLRKRRKLPKGTSCVATNDTAVAATASIHPDTTTTTRLGFHLTEAEMIQILNHSPKEMVDLHLYIDQIHERLTMTEQEELLQIIAQCRRPSRDGSSSNTPLVTGKTTTPVHNNGAVTTNGNIKLED